MPPVRLSEAAQRVLVAYSWPGNVRQLRNLAENMSVTSEEREITPQVLEQYLPRESQHTQLVAVNEHKESASFENEREILYQILFDLRRDVTELKRIVRERQGEGDFKTTTVADNQKLMFGSASTPVKLTGNTDDCESYWEAEEVKDDEPAPQHTVQTELLTPQAPQSLVELERDMVRRALEANNGRRKAAAEQLGISERTLYRKIKEYGLDC